MTPRSSSLKKGPLRCDAATSMLGATAQRLRTSCQGVFEAAYKGLDGPYARAAFAKYIEGGCGELPETVARFCRNPDPNRVTAGRTCIKCMLENKEARDAVLGLYSAHFGPDAADSQQTPLERFLGWPHTQRQPHAPHTPMVLPLQEAPPPCQATKDEIRAWLLERPLRARRS